MQNGADCSVPLSNRALECVLSGFDGINEPLCPAVDLRASLFEKVRSRTADAGHLPRKIFRLPPGACEEGFSASGTKRTICRNAHSQADSERNHQQGEVFSQEFAGRVHTAQRAIQLPCRLPGGDLRGPCRRTNGRKIRSAYPVSNPCPLSAIDTIYSRFSRVAPISIRGGLSPV